MNEWTRTHVWVGLLGYCVLVGCALVYLTIATRKIRREEQESEESQDDN